MATDNPQRNPTVGYDAEIVPPERDAYGARYHVDLVRSTLAVSGAASEQRLTVGAYRSWMEAEEHLHDLQAAYAREGLAGWGEQGQQLGAQPFQKIPPAQQFAATDPLAAAAGDSLDMPGIGTSAHGSSEHPTKPPRVLDPDRQLTADTTSMTDGQALPVTTNYLTETGAQAEDVAWFEATFTDPERDYLLEPLDPTVNYALVVQESDPWTLELAVEKVWRDDRNYVGIETQTLHTYDPDDGLAAAQADYDALLEIYDNNGLQAMMQRAENIAVRNNRLEPNRRDARLFREGPPDRFETLAQQLDDEPNPYWNTDGEVINPDAEVGYEDYVNPFLDDLHEDDADLKRVDYPNPFLDDLPDTQPEQATYPNPFLDDLREDDTDPKRVDYPNPFLDDLPDTSPPQHTGDSEPFLGEDLHQPYWRMETLPVNDPNGGALGHSLHMVIYDGVEHDPEMVGTPAIPEDEPFRMLEVAHFETTDAADKFGVEFNGYLMLGLLEGPELAEEVARLEGHPVEWKTLDEQELDDYRDLKLTLTRDPADWQPYNPNAERDARIEAEGLYTDPIHQFTTFDEEEDDPKVEPTALDFDL